MNAFKRPLLVVPHSLVGRPRGDSRDPALSAKTPYLTEALFLFLLSISATLSLGHAAGEFYVAPTGSDHWSGRRPSPTWRKSDGPFATLDHALQVSRQWRTSAGAGKSPTIFLRGGNYFLSKPVVLGPEDSGLILEAYQREQPVISGGRPIAGWQPTNVAGHLAWAAHVPEVASGKWFFHELWVNGRRAVRSRQPNTGYYKVAAVPSEAGSDWTKGQQRFKFQAGDLKQWRTAADAEVVVMNRWAESRLPIFSVDEQEQVVSFTKRSVFQLAPGDVYYVEGVFEALDQPGEWYLERASGTLYYLPRPGEQLKTAHAIAPVLTQVLRIEGHPEADKFAEKVVIRGIAFAHTEWCFPSGFAEGEAKRLVEPAPQAEVGGFGQAAIGVPGAVWGEGVRACRFEQCAFEHAGNYGLHLSRGAQNNLITGCRFGDLGAGGIKLGETTIQSNPHEQSGGNEVSHCRIEDGGRMFHSAVGIWIGQSPNNRLVHNLIHDLYYTGISIGWTWGYGPALATNNLVAFNHVHHIGLRADGDGPILSDMGGIYTLGMQPGTRICNNLWHDIAGREYGGWGIYFDEGSSSIIAQSNIVYRTTHGGFHQHYGATNFVQNNVFAFARDHQLQRTRPEPHISFQFATNIVYFDHGVLLGGDWSQDQYQIDWNLYFDARPGATPESMRFAGADLQQWRARGHDLHSEIADPLFLAPAQNDYRLKANSPARKLGFQPINLSAVGP